MKITEEFSAQGHPNVLATHPTTFEITKETWLTRRGDCVIAVRATKGAKELSRDFRTLCRNGECNVVVELWANGIAERIEGKGAPGLKLTHPTEMVGRRGLFVSDRTIMVQADRAAFDLRRDLIEALTHSETRLRVRITAEL